MFKIYGGLTAFDQWVMDYALTNEHMSVGDRVSFRTACGGLRVMYAYDDGGTVMVNVPNQLLQDDKPIIVDLHGHPGCKTIFDVIPHDKPDGYDAIYADADRHDPNDLNGRVAALEAGGGSGEVVVFTVTGDEEYGCQQSFEDAMRIIEHGGRCVLRKDEVSDWGRETYYHEASYLSVGIPNDGEPSIIVTFMDYPLSGENSPISYTREGVFFGD